MWDAGAKALVRDYFYLEFLPAQLPSQLLRNGNYLVLLGEGQEEERLLELIGVPPHRIYSVENDPSVFTAQSKRSHQGTLKVVLYHGELSEFITHYLHTNQRFQVFNLDICGAYKTAIDPVMTSVLLFARRNPQTVIATYSSVGRDRPQLREGLKSLALCRWLAPDSTERTVEELFGRYRSAGLSIDVSFNMVLRHLFWLRSHLEHIVLGAVSLGRVRAEAAQKLLGTLETAWRQAADSVTAPLHYQVWLDAVDALKRPNKQAATLDVRIQTVDVATYGSDRLGFYHTGWFCVYRRVAPLTPAEWLEQALSALVAEPLRFAERNAQTLGSFNAAAEAVPKNHVVWVQNDLDRPCRQLQVPLQSKQLAVLSETVEPVEVAETKSTEGPIDVIPLIRTLALQGLNTEEVMARLPQPHSLSMGSVRAYIATARRQASA